MYHHHHECGIFFCGPIMGIVLGQPIATVRLAMVRSGSGSAPLSMDLNLDLGFSPTTWVNLDLNLGSGLVQVQTRFDYQRKTPKNTTYAQCGYSMSTSVSKSGSISIQASLTASCYDWTPILFSLFMTCHVMTSCDYLCDLLFCHVYCL